jgi:hypothetical protein
LVAKLFFGKISGHFKNETTVGIQEKNYESYQILIKRILRLVAWCIKKLKTRH